MDSKRLFRKNVLTDDSPCPIPKLFPTNVVAVSCFLLASCGGDSDGTSFPSPNAVNGFWDGTVVEQSIAAEGTVRALIYQGEMFILRDDQAMFGELILSADDTLEIEFQYYPFSSSDDTNKEFIGTRAQGAERVTANGLLVTETNLVFDYVTLAGDFGSIDITEDGQFSSSSKLDDVTGNWQSTDGILLVSEAGTFLGNNPTTGCNFEGEIKELNTNEALFETTISRNNCAGFNEEASGYATVDTEGNLEFYFKLNNDMLFLEFAPAAATATEGDTGGDTGTGA